MSDPMFQKHNAPQPIHVTVPQHVLYDLAKVQDIQKAILGRLGCGGCTSGFDIRLRGEEEFLVKDVKGVLEISSSLGVVGR